MKPQIEAQEYFSSGYLLPQRMAAYAYQFREITELQAAAVLEVGVGNGLMSWLLQRAGVNLTTLDFDPSLQPDIVAKVTAMPVADRSYQLVACYEVLEHIPYEDVPAALAELRRAATEYVLISLPDARRCLRLYLPGVGKRKFLFENPFFRPKKHIFGGEHYWEINTQGHSLKSVIDVMEQAGLTLVKTYRIWEHPYHRMFVLRVR